MSYKLLKVRLLNVLKAIINKLIMYMCKNLLKSSKVFDQDFQERDEIFFDRTCLPSRINVTDGLREERGH